MIISTELGKIFTALREQKYPFPAVREALKSIELVSGNGWEKLIEKIGTCSAEVQAETARRLSQLLLNKAIAGQKDLHIFPLNDDEISGVTAALKGLETSGPYRETFPLPLPATKLTGQSTELFLTNVLYRENGDVSLIFCSTRTEYDKISYEINQLNEQVQNVFTGCDRVVGIKKLQYQTFDVLNFRLKLRRIEILVDQPNRMSARESSEERCSAVLAMVSTRSNELRHIYENNAPLNLFTCINSMYLQATEGNVKRLAFRAPSQSQKKEQLSSEGDLRTEDFHAAGVLKVGIITVHDITIHWPNLIGASGDASARIKINVGGLSSLGAYIRSAEINCISDTAVTVVGNKLIAHSSS